MLRDDGDSCRRRGQPGDVKAMRLRDSHIHLIYLRPGGMILSRKSYSDWREIQAEYEDYMTSLGLFSEEGLLDFFSEEYGGDDARWAFSRERMREFMRSDAAVLESR
jgi:hypothetical protein